MPGSGSTESFGNDLAPLNLGRLKEFYPEAWEKATTDAEGKVIPADKIQGIEAAPVTAA